MSHAVAELERPARPTAPCGPWRRRNIAAGNFFFTYRNAIFPAIFVLAVPFLQPRIMWGGPGLDRLVTACGAWVALAGQWIRVTTIGFEYIERGGKHKQVYASRLVQGGVYGLTRNPMYAGNVFIALGVTMAAGSPLIYAVVLPLFLFVYQAIIAAEEAYLRHRFGREYDEYCARVNRFLPSLRRIPEAFAGMRYDWKSSVRKELSTMAGLASALILLPLWRTFFLRGWDAARLQAPARLSWWLGAIALYGLLVHLKRRRRLFY